MGFSEGIRRDFKRAAKVLYQQKRYVVFMLAVMLLFAAAGFFYPASFSKEQMDVMKEILALTSGKGFFELAAIIILNNLRAALIGLLFGIFFGILPVLAMAANGFFLGAVLSNAWKYAGTLTLFFIIPHGVFEVPALAVAFGLGLKLGLWFRAEKKMDYIRKSISDFMLVYFYIILPLLILAGFIEAALIQFL